MYSIVFDDFCEVFVGYLEYPGILSNSMGMGHGYSMVFKGYSKRIHKA